MVYKTLTNKVIENIEPYIKDLLKKVPFTKIYVGTDSQNHGDNSVYATAIVLHFNSNNGGHVIYSKESVPRIRDMFTRLYGEVERSMQVARYLRDDCGIDVAYIDLDLNANKKYDSNIVLPAATGYCESFGFKTRFKPNTAHSVRIADVLCR